MIADSVPWKDDLLRIAATLERRAKQTRWTERTTFLVERDIMNGAYAIRKLIDAFKLSDEFVSERIAVQRHALVGRAPDWWEHWEPWEFYDLEHGTSQSLTLREFCNQVIHSWVWLPSATDDPQPKFDGIYVSSDRERKKSVYFISVDTLIETFRGAGEDDIVSLHTGYNERGERTVLRASREHDQAAMTELRLAQEAGEIPSGPVSAIEAP